MQRTDDHKLLAAGSPSSPHCEKMDAIARLASGIAIELTPLIQSAAESVRELLGHTEAGGNTEMAASLDAIRESLQRGAVILRQVEAVARISNRSMVPIDVHGVLEKLRPLFPRLAGPFITITQDLRARVPSLFASPGEMEQVILALVVNSRDAMPLGGTMTIATKELTLTSPQHFTLGELPAGSWLTLSVTDTGTGMDAETLRHVFEPFFTTKPPGLGTGLGLAVLYGVVHQRGGQVVMSTELGKGTTVTVAFPSQPASAAQRSAEDAPHAVLVVDDDEWVRNVTARILRRAGYGVLEASHGEAALELLRDVAGHCVRTVLTDIQMPRMGGSDLAEAVQRDHPGLQVVFMSGDSRSCDAFPTALRKPFTQEELLEAVHRSSVA